MSRSLLCSKSSRSKSTGFTLIEVMVVVIIISIAATVTLFSVDVTGYQKARTLVKQIRFTMRYISDEAILTGIPYALELSRKTRQFVPLEYVNGSWRKSNVVSSLNWDDSIDISLVVDGVTIEEEDPDDGAESDKPYILFWSTGLWEPTGGIKMVVDGFPYLLLNWTASGKMEQKPLQDDEEL